jgi:hypothetical protein
VRDGRLITAPGVTAGIDSGLALVGQRHSAETALKVAKRLVASQQSAMSWRILTMRALANGGVLNIIIEQPSAECGGVCDFSIALFEVFIFRIKTQSVFPCLRLNDASPDTAHCFVLR